MAVPTASDNIFPKLILDEAGTLGTVTAGERRLGIDANGVLVWKNSAGTTSPLVALNKWDATTAPTANEDSGDGYQVGSRWIDVTNNKEYVCVDASAAAAVWTETTQAGGGAGYSEGTSFPGSPSTGDKFFHNTYDMLFFYDGTQWLCACPHIEGIGSTGALVPITSGAPNLARWPLSLNDAVYLEKLHYVVHIATTNSASDYWTLTFASVDGASSTTVDTSNTSALSPNTYVRVERTINAAIATSVELLQLGASVGAGAPGSLFWAAKLQYRFVGT